jgi:hypothetical protein
MEGAMQSRFLRSAVIAAVLVLGVVGCGGGIANQSEPAGAVKAALDATQSGGITKLADYACAAKKGDIANLFGGESVSSLTALGVDPNEVFGAVKFEFKDVQTSEVSRTGESAVVRLNGTMNISIDAAKMRDVMKRVVEAQGQPVDDATLDMVIAGMTSQLSQPQPIDEEVTVVQEGGKWLICS